MKLKKDCWTKKDFIEFEKYLISISGTEINRQFEQKIVNTTLPCLAIKSPIINDIISQISKDNFMQFLSVCEFNYHTETLIYAGLLCKIKDFDTFSQKLLEFSQKIDNWSSCDTLKFVINKDNKSSYFNLAQNLIKNEKTFTRRVGVRILFKFLDDEYIDRVLKIILSENDEKEYYVNMALAWLMCECFIKQREKSLKVFETKKLNQFVQNKAIDKCRDSFRVNSDDKLLLKKLKI